MIPAEAAESLRQYMNLPRQQIAIWLQRPPGLKPGERPIICVAIKPEAEKSETRSRLPGNFSGFTVQKEPWSEEWTGEVPEAFMEPK